MKYCIIFVLLYKIILQRYALSFFFFCFFQYFPFSYQIRDILHGSKSAIQIISHMLDTSTRFHQACSHFHLAPFIRCSGSGAPFANYHRQRWAQAGGGAAAAIVQASRHPEHGSIMARVERRMLTLHPSKYMIFFSLNGKFLFEKKNNRT